MALHIFDLDGTVICSKHRALVLADGSLDLEHWKENCTKEKIFGDSLLPLAGLWRELQKDKANTIAICTARVMSRWDWEFLAMNGLKFHHGFSRPEGCNDADHLLKLRQLSKFVEPIFGGFEVMYDDNDNVRHTIQKNLGVLCVHPDEVILNEKLGS